MINKIYLSGEGPSDLGACRSFNAEDGGCSGEGFKRGPMGDLLDKLIRSIDYPAPHEWLSETIEVVADTIEYVYIPRGELGRFIKEQKLVNRFRASATTARGMAADAMQAYGLGLLAKRGSACLAVLFHDVDGVNSENIPRMYSMLRKAYKEGFLASEYDYGVSMVPMPRSEGWLICVADGYVNCSALETQLSGNDRSPRRSAKVILAEKLGKEATTDVQKDFVVNNVDPNRLYDMNSFKDFSDELVAAIVAKI